MNLAPARAERSVFRPLAGPLRIIVEPAPEAPMTPEQQRRWDALCARNPALFDGPIYTVSAIALPGDEPSLSGIALPGDVGGGRTPENEQEVAGAPIGGIALPGDGTGGGSPEQDRQAADTPIGQKPDATPSIGQKPDATLRCRRSRYHEVLLRRPGDHVQLLSVTALLLCDGRVLLGRRGARLRSYPGLWEIGPAGGLDPAGDPRELGPGDVQTALRTEIREEIGLDVDVRAARLLGVCSDEAAGSLDIVMRLDLPGPLPLLRHGEGWEYRDAAWVPLDQLPAFVRDHQLIAPSLAIMTSLGWIDQPPPPPPPGSSSGSSGCRGENRRRSGGGSSLRPPPER